MSASIFGEKENSPPPMQSAEGYFADVTGVVDWFEQAGRGDRLAWFLSNGLASLEHASFRRDRHPLSVEERWALLAAIERAYRAAWKTLPQDYPRTKIVSGMRAAANLVEFWHKPRKLTSCDPVQDAKALARCFRNDMHNACLLEEVQERAEQQALFGGGEASVFDDLPALAFVTAA